MPGELNKTIIWFVRKSKLIQKHRINSTTSRQHWTCWNKWKFKKHLLPTVLFHRIQELTISKKWTKASKQSPEAKNVPSSVQKMIWVFPDTLATIFNLLTRLCAALTKISISWIVHLEEVAKNQDEKLHIQKSKINMDTVQFYFNK